MRFRSAVHLAAAMLVATACARNGDASSTFSGGSHSNGAEAASTNAGSSDASSSTTSSGGASGEDSPPGTAVGSTGMFDAGVQPDFAPSPVGCKGKIDFLFLVSRAGNMKFHQDQLVVAFPQFIATIEAKFADFDYHIMVVDGDDSWGLDDCTDNCPTLECKVGDECCDVMPCNCPQPVEIGDPCCPAADYPCESLNLVTPCEWVYGSGTALPAGNKASNKPCPIDGGGRYLVKGQQNLPETFACIATVGASGDGRLGQALTAAMQRPINDPGGCNEFFLRDEALLMVTFISTNDDDSEGTPTEWAQAVLDAKHGDEQSVVMFNIGFTECSEADRLCRLAAMFPYHHSIFVGEPEWGPAFDKAASLVETACAGFVPPPG